MDTPKVISDDSRTASADRPGADEFAVLADDGWNVDEQCPWCKKPIDDLHEYVRDGGDYTFECPHCDKAVSGSEWTQYVLKKAEGR